MRLRQNHDSALEACRFIRRRVVELAHKSAEGHVPSSLSIVEILVAVYSRMNDASPDEDVFILSKGHASLSYFATLEAFGLLDGMDLDSFCEINSPFGGHPSAVNCDAVSFSTGSLGHGLPVAAGMAHVFGTSGSKRRVFVLLGDQECNEGSIWEASLLSSTLNLKNLVALVDINRSDMRSMPMGDHAAKWASFGWNVAAADGHSLTELEKQLDFLERDQRRPSVLLCNTVKGKGVSFMENSPEWHHKRITPNDLEKALEELANA